MLTCHGLPKDVFLCGLGVGKANRGINLLSREGVVGRYKGQKASQPFQVERKTGAKVQLSKKEQDGSKEPLSFHLLS